MFVFVVPSSLKPGIIESQIINLAGSLGGEKRKIILLPLDFDQSTALSNKKVEYEKISIRKFLRDNKHKIECIYTRGYDDFIKAYFLRWIYKDKFKIIYDFRAPLHEESYYRHRSRLRKKLLYHLEKWCFLKADNIQTISNNLKLFLRDRFGLDRRIAVVPCSVTDVHLKKFKSRNQIIEFVYVGSVSKWQKFRETIKLYKQIQRNLLNTRLTIITLDIQKAKDILEREGLADYKLISKSHAEVMENLSNYDFGFLLRDDITINRVASPIKFVEYISRGVIPIISPGVGDYSDLVREEDIGITFNNDITDVLEKIIFLNRDENIHKKLFEVASKYTWATTIKLSPLNLYNE